MPEAIIPANPAQEPQETVEQRAERLAIVEALALILKEKRGDAIEARRASGIETIWAEDEAHYDGEDNYNRSALVKGRNMTDGLTESKKRKPKGSTVFLNITAPYCEAASARVADMLFPTDDRNWELKPTPLPQLLESMKDSRPVDQVVQAPPQKPGRLMGALSKIFGGQPAQGPAQEQARSAKVPTVAEVAKQEHDRAVEQAKEAQTWIDDCLVECAYHAEGRKLIECAAKIGTGILKGPSPKKYKKRAVMQMEDGRWTVKIDQKIAPESKFISPWKFYPDGACGDNIHDGSHVWEEDDITARKLLDLKGQGYIDEMIDMVIEEGPCSVTDGTRKLKEGQKTAEKDLFQIWYFNGYVSKKEMAAAGCKCGDADYYPCVVTMVNDRVIKVALSPLDSGEFPYDVMVWKARGDYWAGVGVARQMRACQRGTNAAIRNIMDNAGFAGGPQLIIDRGKIVPANGVWEMSQRKIWWTKSADEEVDVNKAFLAVELPMLLDKMMPILQLWVQKAEEVTGLPMLLQGQLGQSNPTDKVGIAQIQNNNGSTVLRRITRTFDDRITEPHIGRYYEYALLHGPDSAKGDFFIDARGSSALLERDLQNQQMPVILSSSLNPAFGLDPELAMEEQLKAWRFDPKRLKLSDAKKAELAKRQPPKAPQVEVAELREKGATERLHMQMEADAKDSELERQLKLHAKVIDAQLAREDLSAEEQRDLQNHKVDLAKLAMQLKQQRELSPGPQVRQPPTEPAGKAPAGMAYAQ